ncbi:hypothetical protein BD410DRAFT_189986 [Rickenella mellea]|uniref:Uncharacterized protein n=1 Tax=Rickenella mellea TaxID=50990 RepID=A0A4Y7Q7C0_9AGAM|nr:hypothetical protein BD410DRAFT_189986 [Rickenella mellea]
MGAEGFNHRSRPASPSGTSHDILLIAASLDVPTTQDDMLIDTPAQVLAPNISLDNSCQINTFPSLAISAMDSLDFAMVDRFEGSAPANENVPCLPSFAESSETQENVDSPPSTEELANKFESYRDKMDSLILRVRSARRAQEKRQHSPYPKACILPICNRCRSRHCCANLPTSII